MMALWAMKQKVINMKVKNKNMGAWMREQTWVHTWDHGCTCIVLTGHSQRTHDHSHMILCVCSVSPRQCNFAYMQLFIEGVIRQVMLYIEPASITVAEWVPGRRTQLSTINGQMRWCEIRKFGGIAWSQMTQEWVTMIPFLHKQRAGHNGYRINALLHKGCKFSGSSHHKDAQLSRIVRRQRKHLSRYSTLQLLPW